MLASKWSANTSAEPSFRGSPPPLIDIPFRERVKTAPSIMGLHKWNPDDRLTRCTRHPLNRSHHPLDPRTNTYRETTKTSESSKRYLTDSPRLKTDSRP